MTSARGPGPEPGPPPDPLPELLELARREGALEGEGLAAFVEALRARAGLVVAERVERLEQRIRSLEQHTGSLEQRIRSLEADGESLSDDLRKASAAHGALLAHHRELVGRVAAELVSVASLSPLRARQARRRLLALAELLRVDSR